MKNVLLIILTCLSVVLYGQAERQPNLSGTFNASQSMGDLTTWTLTGVFNDASGVYDASGVQVGDVVFFSDGAYTFFLPITEIVSAMHPTLSVKVSKVGITQISSVGSGMKAIFHPTSKGYFPFVSGLSNADQQVYNEYLVSLLNEIIVKKDTSITVAHSTNYIPNLVIATPSRFYNNIYISCKGNTDTSVVAFLAAPNSDHYGVVYNVKNDSGLVETRILSDAHLSNTKTSYLLKPGEMAQVRALRDQRQAGAYKWAVNLLWDNTVISGSGAPTGAAGGDLTGTYPNPALGTGVVISANVLDGTLVNADLASQTIDSNKVKNRAISPVKLGVSGATDQQVLKYNSSTGTTGYATDNSIYNQDGTISSSRTINLGGANGDYVNINGTQNNKKLGLYFSADGQYNNDGFFTFQTSKTDTKNNYSNLTWGHYIYGPSNRTYSINFNALAERNATVNTGVFYDLDLRRASGDFILRHRVQIDSSSRMYNYLQFKSDSISGGGRAHISGFAYKSQTSGQSTIIAPTKSWLLQTNFYNSSTKFDWLRVDNLDTDTTSNRISFYNNKYVFPNSSPGSGNKMIEWQSGVPVWISTPSGGGGISDGDKGDITVSGSGSTWTVDNGAISTAKLASNAVDSTKAANLSPNDLVGAGASTNQVLTWTGSKWAGRDASGGSGTPGGSNTQLQYNSSGAFAGNGNATYDGSTVSVRALNVKLDSTDNKKIIFSSLDAGTGNAGLWYDKTRLPDRQSRPNEVISLGFNWDNSSTGDNSNIRLGIERHYMPFPGAGYYWQEFHAPEVRLTDGTVFRPASWEGRKDIKSGVWTYRADSYNLLASDDTDLLSFSRAGGFKSTATATSSAVWRFLNSEATKEINWTIGADGTNSFNATTGSKFVFQKPVFVETGITGTGLNILSNFTGSNALNITGTVTGSSTPLDISVSSSTGLQGLLYNTSSATNAKATMTVLATGSNADASLFFGNTSVEYWSFGLDASDGRVKLNSNASDPSSGTNHFLVTNTGRVGIGGVNSQNPTARLHLPAGSAAANTGPLKFTLSGHTQKTITEEGLLEPSTDGTRLLYTPTSGVVLDVTLTYRGSGSPETVVTAPPGSIYINTLGGAGTTIYFKETGTGNTGWVSRSTTLVDGQFTTGTPSLSAFGTSNYQRYSAVVELTSGASADTDIPLPTANAGAFGKSILLSPRDLNTSYNINATGSIELDGTSTATMHLTKPTEFVCNIVGTGPTTYRWVVVDNATNDKGSSSASTDGSGDVVITHNKNHTNYVVDIQGTGTTLGVGYTITAKTATTFTVRAYDTSTKAAITSTGVTFDWIIK